MNKIVEAVTCSGLPKRDIRNANRVNLWGLIWALSLGLHAYLRGYAWYQNDTATLLAFIIHSSIGIGMLLAYKKFLIQLDELERKIQLEALALSVGITIIGFTGYSILEKAQWLPHLKPSYIIMLISFTYMFGIISGRIRYR